MAYRDTSFLHPAGTSIFIITEPPPTSPPLGDGMGSGMTVAVRGGGGEKGGVVSGGGGGHIVGTGGGRVIRRLSAAAEGHVSSTPRPPEREDCPALELVQVRRTRREELMGRSDRS